MGLFGGDSSSSNRTDVRNQQTAGEDIEGILAGAGSRVTVNALDGGAISDAFDLGGKAVDVSGRIAANAVAQTGQSLSDILGFAGSVIDKGGSRLLQFTDSVIDRNNTNLRRSVDAVRSAFEQGRSNSQEDILKIGLVLVGGVIFAAMVVTKK